MHASDAYNAGMQYTIRNIPRQLDQALRRKARSEGKSINAAAVEALSRGLGVANQPAKRKDLRDIAGTWIKDEAVEQALRDQKQIDPELWR